MDADSQRPLTEDVKVDTNPKVAGRSKEDVITDIAFQALMNSQQYKQERMNRIMRYERMYLNDIPPRFRQTNDIIVPVFGGLVDSLLADLNDEVSLKFKETKTSDYLTIPKIQAHWEKERDSLKPSAMWNYKFRTDRFNAVLSGRGIFQEYAESEPEYRNVLETINYSDFHCQALGGGVLENHLFCGREGIYRTIEDILHDKAFPEEQRLKFKNFPRTTGQWQEIEKTYGTRLQRFISQGLDPDSNSFTGDPTVNLCRFVVTYQGRRYTVLFDPVTKNWLDVRPWDKDYPFESWATHEDHKNYWSKSFADDFYWIADTVNTLVVQEVTNREKINNQSRAFDPKMYKDVARLDAAQYTSGTLVPYESNPDGAGVRKAGDGIYDFTVPGLNGTITLSQELMGMLKEYTGVGELPPAAKGKQNASVILAQQQQKAKRIGFRSVSNKECLSRLGLKFVEGLKENMPARMSVNIIGEKGFVSEEELTRIEVNALGEVDIKVVSSTEQEQADSVRRQGKVQAVEMVTQSQNLNRFEKEMIYRDIGGFDESQITFALEDLPYTSKRQIAQASLVIEQVMRGKKPDIYYGADDTFVQYIFNWIIDHKTQLTKKKEVMSMFKGYLQIITPIAQDTMKRRAQADKAKAQAQGQLANTAQPQQTDATPTKPVQKSKPKPVVSPIQQTANKQGQSMSQ